MTQTSVLLVDDHALMRQGCRAILAQRSDFAVVGEAENAEEALALAEKLHPTVVVMDVNLPGISGIEVTQRLKAQYPLLHVVILSAHTDEAYVYRALEAGASAYIIKQGAARELVEAIDATLAGHRYLSPIISGVLIRAYLQPPVPITTPTAKRLTVKEQEVLHLLSQGLSNKEIAQHLNNSTRTIEVHRHKIMKKLGLQSLADLVKYAIRTKLVTLDE